MIIFLKVFFSAFRQWCVAPSVRRRKDKSLKNYTRPNGWVKAAIA
jgi:hypothetical protein